MGQLADIKVRTRQKILATKHFRLIVKIEKKYISFDKDILVDVA